MLYPKLKNKYQYSKVKTVIVLVMKVVLYVREATTLLLLNDVGSKSKI